MKRSILVLGCLFLSSSASADPTPAQSAIPAKLVASKRLEAFQAALKGAGFVMPATPPPAAHITLTLLAPSNNGASIVNVGPGVFMNYGTSAAFILQQSAGAAAGTSHGGMTIPTEANKLYVADCTVSAGWSSKPLTVGFAKLATGPTTATHVTPDAGHAYFPFKGNATSTSIDISTVNETFTWFGCEITKVD